MRLSIPADAARIFQAFTQPEYLETWIAFPGDDADSYLVAWRQPDSYRFDHYRSGGRDLIVSGTYRFCRRRKMLFTWRMSGHREQAESLVYIRLFGNFSSTILELHHRGIASAADSLWLQEMWARSLDRLARLFPG
ncbi:MAG TPA: SRPBCC domain-containing protein [Acidobacteriaceae bacterium]|nr:SRPBCC domain-containing protein [Acidobacteriaceae bacterium]